MGSWRYDGARAVTEMLGATGVIQADYTGPISPQAFDALRSEALIASRHARAFVVRVDQAIVLAGEHPPLAPDSYQQDTAPGCIIVRPDQYLAWNQYAQKLAKFGIVRAVFLDKHAQLGYEWALRRSCLYSE